MTTQSIDFELDEAGGHPRAKEDKAAGNKGPSAIQEI